MSQYVILLVQVKINTVQRTHAIKSPLIITAQGEKLSVFKSHDKYIFREKNKKDFSLDGFCYLVLLRRLAMNNGFIIDSGLKDLNRNQLFLEVSYNFRTGCFNVSGTVFTDEQFIELLKLLGLW